MATDKRICIRNPSDERGHLVGCYRPLSDIRPRQRAGEMSTHTYTRTASDPERSISVSLPKLLYISPPGAGPPCVLLSVNRLTGNDLDAGSFFALRAMCINNAVVRASSGPRRDSVPLYASPRSYYHAFVIEHHVITRLRASLRATASLRPRVIECSCTSVIDLILLSPS